jgi:hypothetical protein
LKSILKTEIEVTPGGLEVLFGDVARVIDHLEVRNPDVAEAADERAAGAGDAVG